MGTYFPWQSQEEAKQLTKQQTLKVHGKEEDQNNVETVRQVTGIFPAKVTNFVVTEQLIG